MLPSSLYKYLEYNDTFTVLAFLVPSPREAHRVMGYRSIATHNRCGGVVSVDEVRLRPSSLYLFKVSKQHPIDVISVDAIVESGKSSLRGSFDLITGEKVRSWVEMIAIAYDVHETRNANAGLIAALAR